MRVEVCIQIDLAHQWAGIELLHGATLKWTGPFYSTPLSSALTGSLSAAAI